MKRRLLVCIITGMSLLGVTGVAFTATAESRGPVFMAADQPVTEDQVRQKLQSQGFSIVQLVRTDQYYEVTVSKGGQTDLISVDAQTGDIVNDDDDDD